MIVHESTEARTASDHPATRIGSRPRRYSAIAMAARSTNANDRHAPMSTSSELSSTRSSISSGARALAKSVRIPRRPSTPTIAAKVTQAIAYLTGTRRVRTLSIPAAPSTERPIIPTKNTVAGARKYFVPGIIAYGIR